MDSLKDEISVIGRNIIQEIGNQLVDKNKIATGKLLKSLNYKVIETIQGYTIQVLAEPYLKDVNDGRKPGISPNYNSILAWVKAKPVNFIGKKDSQTAFIITKSIGKKGIVPTHIVDDSISKVLENVDEIIKKGLEKDLQNILNNL